MLMLRSILVPILLAAPAFAADQLKPVFDRMDQAASTFKGLTADLTWVTFTPVINEKETQIATLALKKPKPKDLVALLVIESPNPRRIEFTGKQLRIYYPAMKEIDEYDLEKKYGSVVEKYLLLGFGASSKDLQQAYTIAYGGPETIAGQKASRLELTPRKEDTAFHMTRADLWISDDTGVVVQQKLYIRGGEYHLLTYTNEKIDPNLPDSALKLNAPKDAKKQHPLK